jgi:hypothetical protein
MDLGFITERARYNPVNAGERSYLRKTDTAIEKKPQRTLGTEEAPANV